MRAEIDVEDLLKVVLLLVIVLLALEVIGFLVEGVLDLLGPLRPLISLVVVVLIALWLLDRI